MDLSEAVLVHELSEELRHTGLQLHESVVGGNAQIDDAIVQAHILAYDRLLRLAGVLDALVGASLRCLVGDEA
jgi:hypothetical protein